MLGDGAGPGFVLPCSALVKLQLLPKHKDFTSKPLDAKCVSEHHTPVLQRRQVMSITRLPPKHRRLLESDTKNVHCDSWHIWKEREKGRKVENRTRLRSPMLLTLCMSNWLPPNPCDSEPGISCLGRKAKLPVESTDRSQCLYLLGNKGITRAANFM